MNKKTSNNCNLSTEDINEFILENNIEILCLTNGNKGAEIFSKDKHIKESAISVNVVDTTGAGDCFAAGFIYSYLKEINLEYNLKFAVATGSLSVTYLGGSQFNFYENDVLKLI